VNFVIHQAAIPSVPRSVADPLGNNRSGVVATLNLLLAARDAGVRRMTYASSSSIYGEARDGAAKREDMLPAPLSPYGVSKLAAEQYCMSFHTVYGFEVVALRYFNVFGSRQDPVSEYAAVIPRFITALMRGEPPTIHGDGEQTRDFTFVGNIVRANLHALEHPNAPGQIFNIAMGAVNSLNQIAKTLQELTGVDAVPQYTEPRPGDIRHSLADVSKAAELLQFEPQISVVEGLNVTIDWYRAQSSATGTK
jgi:nucleoside-diphosphate-sugar epimerase